MRSLSSYEAQLTLQQRFRIAVARSMRLLAKKPPVAAEQSLRQRWQEARAQAECFLKEWDEGKHPRVPAGGPDGGQFGEGGGGSSPEIPDTHLDPKVVEVGGDAWNKATARRLEREYQTAKPKLEAMLSGTDEAADIGEEPDTEDDEEETPYVPEEWSEVNEDTQYEAEQEYYSTKLSGYVDSENQSWHDNGGAKDEAKVMLADDSDFVHDALKEYMDDNTTADEDGNKGEATETGFEKHYTLDQLAMAITLDYQSDGEGNGDLTVNFDDSELTEPISAPPKEQQTLPGIEPEDLSQRLTEKMRTEIETALTKALDKAAEDKADDMTPPDYLADQAKEYMEEDWSNNMTDDQKFAFAKYESDIISNLQEEAGDSGGGASLSDIKGLPKTYDPLNETSGDDYRKTQKLARVLSIQRAAQVFTERKIETTLSPNDTERALRKLDRDLWSAWKSSSTSTEGQLLQVATADELGGRLNPKTGRGGQIELDPNKIVAAANKEYGSIGGYAGIKAYVRAKWETTQFLLDKAGINELELYRGIVLDPDKYEQAQREKALALIDIVRKQMVGTHSKVPNLVVVRNGAASTTTNPSVANGWSSDSTRVVLRALMPRTAAVSVPAYGINVKSEQEVVVAGTAWKAWDAWLGQAPTFKNHAMAA